MAASSRTATPRRAYGGISHEVRVAERRKAFIEAGLAVFGSTGFHGATVRLICREAGLTDRYFYESFASTEALLIAVYEQLTAQLRADLLAALGSAATLEDGVEKGLRVFFGFMRDPRHARILLVEILGVSAGVNRIWQRSNAEFGAFLVSAQRALGPARGASPEDDLVLGQTLVGAMAFAAASWMLSGYRQPVDRLVDICRQVLVGGLREVLALPAAEPAPAPSPRRNRSRAKPARTR